jgi:hypothetical protein
MATWFRRPIMAVSSQADGALDISPRATDGQATKGRALTLINPERCSIVSSEKESDGHPGGGVMEGELDHWCCSRDRHGRGRFGADGAGRRGQPLFVGGAAPDVPAVGRAHPPGRLHRVGQAAPERLPAFGGDHRSGLPDGSGLDLIRTMRDARRLACPSCWAHRARNGRHRPLPAPAGADGFLPKPVPSLAAFQARSSNICPTRCVPRGRAPRPRRRHARSRRPAGGPVPRAGIADARQPAPGLSARFLIGLARTADDKTLECSAQAMDGCARPRDTVALRSLINDRIRRFRCRSSAARDRSRPGWAA